MSYRFIEKFIHNPATPKHEKIILINLFQKFMEIVPSGGENPFLDDIKWIGEACTTSTEIINLLYAILAPFEHEKFKLSIIRVYDNYLFKFNSKLKENCLLVSIER